MILSTNKRGLFEPLFFWWWVFLQHLRAKLADATKRGNLARFSKTREQNKTMKNTRGEREGGRQPPLANRLQSFQSADDLDGGSRQIMSESVGHSRPQAGGQTRGNRTRGKPPACGLAAPCGSRQKMSQPICRPKGERLQARA